MEQKVGEAKAEPSGRQAEMERSYPRQEEDVGWAWVEIVSSSLTSISLGSRSLGGWCSGLTLLVRLARGCTSRAMVSAVHLSPGSGLLIAAGGPSTYAGGSCKFFTVEGGKPGSGSGCALNQGQTLFR